jgi:transmembrane sensor
MRKDSNIGKNGLLDEDGLGKMLSQLKIPPSPRGKEEVWSMIMDGIESEQRKVIFNDKAFRWIAAAVILLIVSSLGISLQFSNKRLETPYGKVAYAILPDSSILTINAGTIIEHKDYGFNRKRVVKIKGEALFDVKKRETEFVVIAGDYRIRVIGTRFNVLFRNENLVVKCIEGTVEVEGKGKQKHILNAGEGISLLSGEDSFRKISIDKHRAVSWTQGEFFYTQTPLDKVFAEIERQFNVKIHTQGFNPKERLYTGYFNNENILIALELVCLPMGLKHEVDNKTGAVKIYP